MSYNSILQFLFGEDENGLFQETERSLHAIQKSIEELTKEKKHKMEMILGATTNTHMLKNLYTETFNRNNYQMELDLKLQKLFYGYLKFGKTLQNVPWQRLAIEKNIETLNRLKENEKSQKRMEEIYKRMESRHVVVELRRALKYKQKLEEIVEKSKNKAAEKCKKSNLRINDALKARNDIIVNLVSGSKLIEKYHSKLQQKRTTIVKKKIKRLQKKPSNLCTVEAEPTKPIKSAEISKNSIAPKAVPEARFPNFGFNCFNFVKINAESYKIPSKEKISEESELEEAGHHHIKNTSANKGVKAVVSGKTLKHSAGPSKPIYVTKTKSKKKQKSEIEKANISDNKNENQANQNKTSGAKILTLSNTIEIESSSECIVRKKAVVFEDPKKLTGILKKPNTSNRDANVCPTSLKIDNTKLKFDFGPTKPLSSLLRNPYAQQQQQQQNKQTINQPDKIKSNPNHSDGINDIAKVKTPNTKLSEEKEIEAINFEFGSSSESESNNFNSPAPDADADQGMPFEFSGSKSPSESNCEFFNFF